MKIEGEAANDLLRMHAAVGLAVDERTATGRVKRAIALARSVGAPRLPAIDAALAAERDDRACAQAVAVATAQARTVAAGLTVAPLFLVPLLSRVANADFVAFYATPAGRIPLVVGVGLLASGALAMQTLIWAASRQGGRGRRRAPVWLFAGLATAVLVHPLVGVATGVVLMRRAKRGDNAGQQLCPDEAVELVATAVEGGYGPSAALRAAAEHLPADRARLRALALRLELVEAPVRPEIDQPASGFEMLAAVLETSRRVGAPAVGALRAFGSRLRDHQRTRALQAVERLPAQLAFPTALLLLPGTVLLVSAPLVSTGIAHLVP